MTGLMQGLIIMEKGMYYSLHIHLTQLFCKLLRCLPYVQLILKYRYLKEIIKVIQLTKILRIKIEKKFGITDTIVKILRKSCHIPIKLKSVLNATFKIRILIYEMPILMFEFIVNHYY